MKKYFIENVVCPVSAEKVNEIDIRLTALWVVLLMIVFLLTGFVVIPLFLFIDFSLRAMNKGKLSPLFNLSRLMVVNLRLGKRMIDKAPKIFAARLGLLFTFFVSVLALSGMVVPGFIISILLITFAFLECGINFCAGCWVYSFVVKPLIKDEE